MKRSLISLVAALVLALSLAGGVSAQQTGTPGTPGTQGNPNCVGQTMAFLTQPSAVHRASNPGIGNLRKWTNQVDPNHPDDARLISVGWCSGTGF